MTRKSAFGAEPEQVRELLSFGLEDSNNQRVGPTASLGAVLERPGGQIGRYKLLSVLGEGGMGIVYLAEQEGQIRRKVALKVIKPGMDSKRVIARFETERQALALLDHPNIAQVYDAGTTESGRPYFVMEHVKGSPITEYCDRHKLSIEDRLILFQEVCAGLQHAHQKGIIHRDIKPSNILVSAGGDKAIPKIIDFGVAKAVSQPLTERTVFTEDSQLLGTPEYMSPEQADMANEDVDTRSDIYSLGVLLYVLLAGVMPFDSDTLRTGGIEHIRKTIRETDPKTPSTRLTKLGDQARELADSRRTEIAALAKCLHRELEWIPLKAMRKDRSERYRSASEMADDIENYLNGEPLIAGPPGTSYKFRKFVRRNRVLVSGITTVLVVLVAGIVVSTIFAIGQARARVEADNARAEALLVVDFLENDVLGSADKAKADEATVSFILDAASKTLDEGKFKDKPLIEASIYRTFGDTYWLLGEMNKGEQHLLNAIQIYRQHLGDEHVETLKTEGTLGYVYEKQGRYHDMERQFTKTRGSNGLGAAYLHLGKYEDGARVLEKAIESKKAWIEQTGKISRIFPYLIGNLARVYTAQGRYEEAELQFAELQGNEWHAVFPYGLASLYREQGRYGDAEILFNRHLETLRQRHGDEHFLMVSSISCLVQLYIDQDRYEKAKTLLDEVLPIARRRMRPEHPITLHMLNAYAVLHTKQKQYDQAEKLFDEVLNGRRHELGDDHPETLKTINDLGILHKQQKNFKHAEKFLTEALEKRKIKLGSDHPHTLQSMNELAILYKEQERYEDAEKYILKVVEGRRRKLGDTHPHTLESWHNLIDLYEVWNKQEKANEWQAKLPQTEASRE